MTTSVPADTADHALDAAAQAGAEACVAVADDTRSTHVRWAAGSPTATGTGRSRRLTVGVVADGSAATLAREGIPTRDAVGALVRDAVACARDSAAAGRRDGPVPLGAGGGTGGGGSGARAGDLEALCPLLPRLADAVARARHHGAELSGYAETQHRTTAVASSAGLRTTLAERTAVAEVVVTAGGRSTWAGSDTDPLAAVDPVGWADRLCRHLRHRLHADHLPAGRYDVVLSPSAVADLLLHLYGAAILTDAVAGRSVFSAPGGGTRIGQRLTAAPLTLYGDPAHPVLRCAPLTVSRAHGPGETIFDTGWPLTRTDWIRDGVLTALPGTRAAAEAAGAVWTPPVGNLVLDHPAPDRTDIDGLVAGMRRGLLVTSLWYLRVLDPATALLSGVTRDGLHLVENGEISATVPDMRLTVSPVDLLSRVTGVGRTVPALPREWAWRSARTATPALRVGEVDLAPSDCS